MDQFGVATAALLVCMAMTLIRSIAGPTVFDRVLAVNSFGTKTVLLIVMNFIGTIAVMKFTRFGDLAGMEEDEEEIL
jgi:multicomponent Na+:H+ antiporter subunit F